MTTTVADTSADTAAALSAVTAAARQACGDAAVITDHARLRTYECDGLTAYAVVPALVVLVRSSEQVRAVVRACHENTVPFVARGSGTGLSGGALPHADGVLIVTSQMRRVIDIDPVAQRAVVEPGVVNLEVTAAAAPHGYYYAPDPSSQQICSIGGNVAENSGGAHCLKYGFTTNHVLAVELVTPQGELTTLGTSAPDSPGYDLLGIVVGSEGTLGVVTEVTVRLVRRPEVVRTLLAGFASTDAAGAMGAAFAEMYRRELPIRAMYRVDRFGWSKRSRGGDDYASMAAGNTSAFNCRDVTGRLGTRSPHSWGRSLDINTWENPYRSAKGIVPNRWWQPRSDPRVAWRSRSHAVVRVMARHELHWSFGNGDTQHFDYVGGGKRLAGGGPEACTRYCD